ncbi:MAG: T9SS type A sorting domain-containing protein, partial [Bacteroidaceae bacterium]|nr:T9SS type A sorting domain-containing protein [Bacteroidaceae bacterium]
FEDHLYVNTQGMSGHGNIIIHNTTGKNVLSQKYVLGDIINIPVAQLPAGMYILTLKAGRNLLTQKIIVR